MNKRKQAEYGRKGGKIGGRKTGSAKVRGDSAYYRARSLESWAKRRNKALVANAQQIG